MITPLPPYRGLSGPVTRARLTRLVLVYLALVLAGSALFFGASQDSLQIAGLGLMLPGGGFLAHADVCTTAGFTHLAAALLAAGSFVLAVGIWFGTGNILAPPLVWLGAAAWAATMRHGPVSLSAAGMVFGLVGLAALLLLTGMAAVFFTARRRRQLDNAWLASQAPGVDAIFTAAPDVPGSRPEMTLEHLQRLRFALDRALQPTDQFGGFEKLDQFQTAATRYQINFLAYGIALTQARFTPAFGGYMHQAQSALIDKQAEHRVWSYWGLENLWGNLSRDPDPVARENIMYTGFVALQMALFRASTGRGDFAVPGRLTLRHPSGQQYAHDVGSLAASLERGYRDSAFFLMACEPNWIYPLCNMLGASALKAHDAQSGSARWAAHAPGFVAHLEAEFLDGAGRYVPCRSARTGLALPAIGGVMPLAMPCFFLHAIEPGLARRQWLLLRRGLFDGKGRFRRRAFWPIDTGNYGFSRASAYVATALAAAELGDGTVHDACMAALEDECPSLLRGGVIHRPKASVWSHGVELMVRAGVRDGFQQLIANPPERCGPRLEEVPYPQVLVAGAHAQSGGLQAVLYGVAGEGRGDGVRVYELGLAGLRPGASYRVTGALAASLEAGDDGRAKLRIELAGRTCLTLEPEEGQ